MALDESSGTGMYMPVAPAYGMGGNGGFQFLSQRYIVR